MTIQTIKSLLNESNFRLTKEREAVLETLMHSGRMLTPGELYQLAKENHQRVGLTTVYRLLEVLTKIGLATPFLIEGEIFYAYCPEDHHHHFVCLSCHRIKDIYGCSQAFEPENAPGTVEYHRLDLFGHCQNCQEENPTC